MGSWNHTCAISNLHVTAGTEVYVFMLLQNRSNADGSFCYGNSYYDVAPLPFYGKYDDYGGVEDCHGFGLPIVMEAIRDRLYKFGQGPNSVHDIEVSKEDFDITTMFEADHEGRLGIEEHSKWNGDEYALNALQNLKDDKGLTESQKFEMDRLASKLKKEDNFRRVTHVVVHGEIAKDILNNWYIEDYVGNGNGTTGYGNSYIHVYFKDLISFIPEYVNAQREKVVEIKNTLSAGLTQGQQRALRRIMSRSSHEDWNSPNLAARWISSFSGSSSVWGLIDVNEHINEYVEAEDWDGLAKFVHETLTAAWINAFMSYTRKAWVKPTGQGSQSNEPLGYQVLSNSVLRILKEEGKDCEDDDE